MAPPAGASMSRARSVRGPPPPSEVTVMVRARPREALAAFEGLLASASRDARRGEAPKARRDEGEEGAAFRGAFGIGEAMTYAEFYAKKYGDAPQEEEGKAQARGFVAVRVPKAGTNDPDGDALSAFERPSVPAGLVVRRAPVPRPVDPPFLSPGGKLVLQPRSAALAQALAHLQRRGCAVPLALKLQAAERRGAKGADAATPVPYAPYVPVTIPNDEAFREALADHVGEANADLADAGETEKLHEPYLEATLLRVAAAVSIQCSWRAFLARQSLVPDICSRVLRRRACVFIQRWLRGRTLVRRMLLLGDVAAVVKALDAQRTEGFDARVASDKGERELVVTYECQEAFLRQQERCAALPKQLSLIAEQQILFTFDKNGQVIVVNAGHRTGLPMWTGVDVPQKTLAQLTDEFGGLPPTIFTAHDVAELLRNGATVSDVEPSPAFRHLPLERRPYRRVTFANANEAKNRAALLVALTWHPPSGAYGTYAARLEDSAALMAKLQENADATRTATSSVALSTGGPEDEAHSLVTPEEDAEAVLAALLANKLPKGSPMRLFVGLLRAPSVTLQHQLARCLQSKVTFLSADERLFARLVLRGAPRDVTQTLRPEFFETPADHWGRQMPGSDSFAAFWHSLDLTAADGTMVGAKAAHASATRREACEDRVVDSASVVRADSDFLLAARDRARANLIRDVELLKLRRSSGVYRPLKPFSANTDNCINVNPPTRDETLAAFEKQNDAIQAANTANATTRRDNKLETMAHLRSARASHEQALRDRGTGMKIMLASQRSHTRRAEDHDATAKAAAVRKMHLRSARRKDAMAFATAFQRQGNALTREIRVAELHTRRSQELAESMSTGKGTRVARSQRDEAKRADAALRKDVINAKAEAVRTFLTQSLAAEYDARAARREAVAEEAARAREWHSRVAPMGGNPFPVPGALDLTHRLIPMTTVARAESDDEGDFYEDEIGATHGNDIERALV